MDEKIDELKKKITELEKQVEQESKKKKEKKKKKNPKKEIKKKGHNKYQPLEIYYSWESPSRTYEKKDKPWFLKVAIAALLLILFFAFLQDFIVILVICVIVLILFLLSSIPPNTVKHVISNKWIKTIETKYKWKELKDFWVAVKNNQTIVYIGTKLKFPPRLLLIINKENEEKVIQLLGKYLEYKEFDKKQGWVSRTTDGIMINPKKYDHLFDNKSSNKS